MAATAVGSGDSSWYDSGNSLVKDAFTFAATRCPSMKTEANRAEPVESGGVGHRCGSIAVAGALTAGAQPGAPATMTDTKARLHHQGHREARIEGKSSETGSVAIPHPPVHIGDPVACHLRKSPP